MPDRERAGASSPDKEIEPELSRDKAPEPEPPARGKQVEMDMGM